MRRTQSARRCRGGWVVEACLSTDCVEVEFAVFGFRLRRLAQRT